MKKIVSFTKRRGFIFPSSEIYGGFGSCYDYGPLGVELKRDNLIKAFGRFKDLADKKKEVFDEDLMAIVEEELVSIPETYRLEYFNIIRERGRLPKAEVAIRKNAVLLKGSSSGDGPVDACYKAIDSVTRHSFQLLDYSLKSTTGGKDALGEVHVRIRPVVALYEVLGRSASTDIIEASIKAYLNALNKFLFARQKEKKSVHKKLKL